MFFCFNMRVFRLICYATFSCKGRYPRNSFDINLLFSIKSLNTAFNVDRFLPFVIPADLVPRVPQMPFFCQVFPIPL